MAPRAGDAAIEKQLTVRIVKDHVAGGLRSKAVRLFAVRVELHVGAGNGFGALSERGFCPILGYVPGLYEKHVHRNGSLAANEQPIQFADAGFGAGTVGVSKHQQG